MSSSSSTLPHWPRYSYYLQQIRVGFCGIPKEAFAHMCSVFTRVFVRIPWPTGALVLDRELSADCSVPYSNDRHDPYPQPSPWHHALQPGPYGRGEGRRPGGDGLEGRVIAPPEIRNSTLIREFIVFPIFTSENFINNPKDRSYFCNSLLFSPWGIEHETLFHVLKSDFGRLQWGNTPLSVWNIIYRLQCITFRIWKKFVAKSRKSKSFSLEILYSTDKQIVTCPLCWIFRTPPLVSRRFVSGELSFSTPVWPLLLAALIVFGLCSALFYGGWRWHVQLVHADVFRPPAKYPMLFCVLVGTGVQLMCMGFVTICFAAIGWDNVKTCPAAKVLYGHKADIAGRYDVKESSVVVGVCVKACHCWRLDSLLIVNGFAMTTRLVDYCKQDITAWQNMVNI